MAYWQIPFQSLNGDNYIVRISGRSGNSVTLTGAAEPFVTQEDDDRYMFKPVRLQSGYLRIVDLGGSFDWHYLMPSSATDRKVELLRYQSGNWVTEWQGFIRPETFSGTFRELPQEREFPVCCPLSALEAFDVTVSEVHNFAWLILHLLTNFYTIDIESFVFSRPLDVVGWLQHRFQPQNFVDDEGEPKYNGLELLEEICKFWGWTCHIDGKTVYFLQADDSTAGGLGELTLEEMQDVAAGDPLQLTSLAWSTASLSAKSVVAGGTEEYIQGVKNVTVTSDINKQEQIVSVPMDDWVDKYKDYALDPGVIATGYDPSWTFVLYESLRYNPRDFQWDNKDLWIDFHYTDYGGGVVRYGGIIVFDKYDGNIADKHNYDFKGCLVLGGGSYTPNATNYLARIVTKKVYTLTDGMIVLNMSCLPDTSVPQLRLSMAVKVGGKWWDGANEVWSDTFSYIPGMLFDPDRIPDFRVLNGPYQSYNGYGIPVQNMSGVIEVYLYGGNVSTFAVSSFELSFARKIAQPLLNENSENVYEEKGVANFQNDVSVDTIFASDNNNEYGAGIIMTPTGAYASVVEYSTSGGSSPEHPEQHLVDRIAAYGAAVKKVLSVNVQNNELAPVSPATKITAEDGKTYAPVAISREWREDITNYTLMEL